MFKHYLRKITVPIILIIMMTTMTCEKLFDISPPNVAITEPSKGSKIKVGKITTIKIDATDNSKISEVEIYVDNKLFGSLESSPYYIEWKPISVGEYTIEAKAYDGGGNWDEDEISIIVVANLPPEITSFAANPTSGKVPLTVNFVCIASDPDGEIVSYAWNFGDSEIQTTTSGNMIHTYPDSGNYTAKVIVKDDGGATSSAEVAIAVVANLPPEITSFTADPNWGEVPLQVNFICSAHDPDGEIVNYSWNFGDGGIQTTSSYNTNHSYLSSGNYDAMVTITDNDGATDSASVQISIIGPGVVKWELGTGYLGIESSPSIGNNGIIYVGSSNNKLYAINPDGTKYWEFESEGEIESTPTIGNDGTIYMGSFFTYMGSYGKLYAINPNGTKKWEFAPEDWVTSSPAIGNDGTIYVGSCDNKLYAINPNGTKKWEFVTGDWVTSSPAIGSDGTIYVGSSDNKLYAISPSGTKKWEFETGGSITSSPAIGNDGIIYVGSSDNKLYAVYPVGIKKWEFVTEGRVRSSPAIGSDGTIYVGSSDGKLYAINPEGTNKWEFEIGFAIGSSPAIGGDGTIYVGSWDYKLYSVNADGVQKWEFETGGGIFSSPAIGSDGTIYVGSDKLYAIFGESGGLANSSWPKFRHDNRNTGNVNE